MSENNSASTIHLSSKTLGFSLIELLLTLTLSSILLLLSLPLYKLFITEVRLSTLTEQIRTAIHYARSEATKRQGIVTLCKSSDQKTCSGQWHDGWIIFFSKKERLSDKKKLLRVYPALDGNISLAWKSSLSKDYLQWYPSGTTHGQNGSFILCTRVLFSNVVWLIKISQTGRVRVDKKLGESINCNY